MLPALFARRPAATGRLLGLRAVADDHLLLADGTPVAVLAAAAPALALRGPDEADRAIEALHLALASLAFPLHVVVALGPLDVEAAVAAHAAATAAEPDAARRRLAADHRAFLRALAHDHRLLERRAYLAVAAPGEPGPAAAPRGLAHWVRRAPSAPRPAPAEALRELAPRSIVACGRARSPSGGWQARSWPASSTAWSSPASPIGNHSPPTWPTWPPGP
jgi:hypothetical protein